MDKDVKIIGSLNYSKFKEIGEDFVKKDIERIMNNHVVAHEKDKVPHYYNKDDSYSITADYSLRDEFCNTKGSLIVVATYKYGNGAIVRKMNVFS